MEYFRRMSLPWNPVSARLLGSPALTVDCDGFPPLRHRHVTESQKDCLGSIRAIDTAPVDSVTRMNRKRATALQPVEPIRKREGAWLVNVIR